MCVYQGAAKKLHVFKLFSWVFLEEKFTELLSIHVHKSVFLTCGNSFFIIDLLSCNIETQRRILKFDSWKEREYIRKKKEFEIRLKVTKRCVTLYTCSKELTRASLLSCFHHDTFPNDK